MVRLHPMTENEQPKVCDYEGSDYQSTFWDEGHRAYEDGAEEIALKRLLPPKGRLMLEIGAGAGRNTPRYHGYERIVVLDYSVTQLQQARERLGASSRYVYVAADAYQLPFVDGLFDGATMIRVLHHMVDGQRAIIEVRRILEKGGVFILEFANKLNVKSILRYFLRKQSWSPFSPEPIEFVELNLNFHPRTTREWLKKAQFSRERQLTVSHFRMGFLKRLVPTRLLVAADALASLTGDLWQLSPSVFVRSKAEGESKSPVSGQFFQCPDCGGSDLEEHQDRMHCNGCGKDWRIENGIYIFK